jgi:hypothetical protein
MVWLHCHQCDRAAVAVFLALPTIPHPVYWRAGRLPRNEVGPRQNFRAFAHGICHSADLHSRRWIVQRWAILAGLAVMAALSSGPVSARTTYYWCNVWHGYYPVVPTCPQAWRRIEVETPRQISPPPATDKDRQRDICTRPRAMDALYRALVSGPGFVGARIESARTISGEIHGNRQTTCVVTIVSRNGERNERPGIVTRWAGGVYTAEWAGRLVEHDSNGNAAPAAKEPQAPTRIRVSRVSRKPAPAPPPEKPALAVRSGKMPYAEAAVIRAAEAAMEQYRAARDTAAKVASRPARASAICSALPNRRAVWWLGTVREADTNNGGMGVLSIEVAPSIVVETNNNAYYDDLEDFGTLIDPRSGLFATVARLRKGDRVRFNGSFPASEEDCVKESGLTLEDSVTRPAFIMRFDRVGPN